MTAKCLLSMALVALTFASDVHAGPASRRRARVLAAQAAANAAAQAAAAAAAQAAADAQAAQTSSSAVMSINLSLGNTYSGSSATLVVNNLSVASSAIVKTGFDTSATIADATSASSTSTSATNLSVGTVVVRLADYTIIPIDNNSSVAVTSSGASSTNTSTALNVATTFLQTLAATGSATLAASTANLVVGSTMTPVTLSSMPLSGATTITIAAGTVVVPDPAILRTFTGNVTITGSGSFQIGSGLDLVTLTGPGVWDLSQFGSAGIITVIGPG